MTKPKYPTEWSLAEVQVIGGGIVAIHVPVGPGIGEFFTQKMRDTGFLTLRNDKESVSIAADRIVAFKLTSIVGDQTP